MRLHKSQSSSVAMSPVDPAGISWNSEFRNSAEPNRRTEPDEFGNEDSEESSSEMASSEFEEYTLIKPTRDSVCGVRLRSYEEEAGVQILALEPGGLAASSGLKV